MRIAGVVDGNIKMESGNDYAEIILEVRGQIST
jgi:hypothetical protein